MDDEYNQTSERESLLRNSNGDEECEYTISPLPDSPSPTSDTYFSKTQGALGRETNGRTQPPFSATNGGIPTVQVPPIQAHSSNQTKNPRANELKNVGEFGESAEVDGAQNQKNANHVSGNLQNFSLSMEVKSIKGQEVLGNIKKAYQWKNGFEQSSPEFLALMDRLFMECQLHLTALSSRGDLDSRKEADMLVNEMVNLRNHWGPNLLPKSICNAFVRERIPLTLGVDQRQFRIDCAQFFEPVPFYGNQQGNPGELMKLYRFSVYDISKNEVVLRYYLERSNVIQLYHVLCFTCENFRGQVHPYGAEIPSYWEIRQRMLEDVYSRLLSALSQGNHPPPRAHASTIFPATSGGGPIIIQVPSPVVAGQK